MQRIKLGVVAFGLSAALWTGCKDASSSKEPVPPASSKETKLTNAQVKSIFARAKPLWLVPHPSEIQNALKDLGLSRDVSALVAPLEPDFAPMDGPRIALNTGVITADLLLTLEQATPAQTAKRLNTISRGLKELGTPEDYIKKLEQMARRVEAGALTPQALSAELDGAHAMILEAVEKSSSTDAVVGLQAGAWLRAINIVANAILKGNKGMEGAHLFHQPEVVAHFLRYLEGNKDKVQGSPVLEQALPSMRKILEIASRQDVSAAELPPIIDHTSRILGRI